MTLFTNDYCEGAHPRILEILAETNLCQQPGYGADEVCAEAAALLKKACGAPQAEVHFVVGGTQANLLVHTAALRPHQAGIAPASGHVSTHETGAIEATGHKVVELPGKEGRLLPEEVRAIVEYNRSEQDYVHTVQPRLCYISFPTEYGTLYSRAQLEALSATCRELGLYLYMDGARLGYGLCAETNDLDLPAIARLCDAFTIGGTKLGALFGEAVVFTNPDLARDFRCIMKQRGAMLAKGWLLGLQYKALFGEDELYFTGARHAIAMAGVLTRGIQALGIPLLMPPATNQIFPILPNGALPRLREKYGFEVWEAAGEAHTAIRFVTSWATRPESVKALCDDLAKL